MYSFSLHEWRPVPGMQVCGRWGWMECGPEGVGGLTDASRLCRDQSKLAVASSSSVFGQRPKVPLNTHAGRGVESPCPPDVRSSAAGRWKSMGLIWGIAVGGRAFSGTSELVKITGPKLLAPLS